MSIQLSQFLLLLVFLKAIPVIQKYGFEISHTFLPRVFIQSFQFTFLEDSVKIIIADFGVIPSKNDGKKNVTFLRTSAEGQVQI